MSSTVYQPGRQLADADPVKKIRYSWIDLHESLWEMCRKKLIID